MATRQFKMLRCSMAESIVDWIRDDLAPVVSASLPPPPPPARVAASAGGERGVQLIAPRDAAESIARSKGILVVQVTSFDTTCGFCVRSMAWASSRWFDNP